MENVEVEVIAKGIVQPASPAPQPWLSLSPCDVLMCEVNYTRRVLFYNRPPIDMDFALLVRRLQVSLANALVHFYPLAGRLALCEGRLAVHCNDEGVEFVQAAIGGGAHRSLLSQLQSCHFAMQPFFTHLTRWASYSPSLHRGSAPLLSIQVTRFTCGGIALGVALSHVIADGTSFWHFMTSWVECARGKLPSLLPIHKRSLLKLQVDTPLPLKKVVNFFEYLHGNAESKDEKKVQRAFSFSQEMLQNLKEATKHQYSSYELICAHIWRHTVNAWDHPSDTRVGFINVVNMRERVDPPLPRGYFGNAIMWSIATTTVGQLRDETLGNTAARIHDAVLACSSSRMQQFLHLLEVHSCSSHKILLPLVCNEVRVRVSSSTKFPVFDINFGWGNPLASRSASIEENNKVAFYPGGHGSGDVDICMAQPTHVMQALENNPSFLGF